MAEVLDRIVKTREEAHAAVTVAYAHAEISIEPAGVAVAESAHA